MQQVQAHVFDGLDDEVRREVEHASEAWRTDPGIYCLSGLIYMRAGNAEAAAADFALAILLDPDGPAPYRYLAYLLRRRGAEEVSQLMLEMGWQVTKRMYRGLLRRVPRGEREQYFDLDSIPEFPLGYDSCDQT